MHHATPQLAGEVHRSMNQGPQRGLARLVAARRWPAPGLPRSAGLDLDGQRPAQQGVDQHEHPEHGDVAEGGLEDDRAHDVTCDSARRPNQARTTVASLRIPSGNQLEAPGMARIGSRIEPVNRRARSLDPVPCRGRELAFPASSVFAERNVAPRVRRSGRDQSPRARDK